MTTITLKCLERGFEMDTIFDLFRQVERDAPQAICGCYHLMAGEGCGIFIHQTNFGIIPLAFVMKDAGLASSVHGAMELIDKGLVSVQGRRVKSPGATLCWTPTYVVLRDGESDIESWLGADLKHELSEALV